MTGLVEYIRWLGRFSFDELPMGEADALVLCVLVYFDLRPALGADGTALLADCGSCVDNIATLLITGSDMGNKDIFRAAVASRRFGALRVTACEDVLEPATPLQFAAVTFRWEGGGFLAFRGTDETIAGWREDFMLSFAETPAQRLAAAYAERVLAGDGRFWMGGHSKGGNLALYAACRVSPAAWERLERVFVLDGPGSCPEVLSPGDVARIDGKTTRILPAFSVVGKLFEPAVTDTRIVCSSAAGILQHSLATWQVEYGDLAPAAENDRRSRTLMEILNRWIAGLDYEDRRRVTDELFDALAAGGAVYLSEIAGAGPKGFEAVLLRMFHASEETKKIMKELPAQALAALRRHLGLTEEL